MEELSSLPMVAHYLNSRKTCPQLYPSEEGSHIYSWNVGHPSPCSLPSPPPGYFSHQLVQPSLKADKQLSSPELSLIRVQGSGLDIWEEIGEVGEILPVLSRDRSLSWSLSLPGIHGKEVSTPFCPAGGAS